MTKTELVAAVEAAKAETREALQLVYDSLNEGQKKKIIKNDEVLLLFKRYDVKYDE